MMSRILSHGIAVAILITFMFVPASVFAGSAAEAMNKLKEQTNIKTESSSVKASASRADAEAADAKAKAKKAVKELLKKRKETQ
ncbi:MAG: hypothetical protein MRJ96_08685 [Nitrospirales bacterium]|nr:hypothetical protein [Nitrospira sp.]MDR4501509.1 hypothetical protein [Nitrospirales bacterium]